MARPQPGDYFKRHYGDLLIYGYAMTEKEFSDSEAALGAFLEELDFAVKQFRRWTARGWLYGKCYSVACISGEYGTTPSDQAAAITKEDFEAARQQDWNDK